MLVTAVLLAFSITPLLPCWLTVFGTAAAVLLGKHLFGGLGQNPFNPAMVGYAMLLCRLSGRDDPLARAARRGRAMTGPTLRA